MKAPGTAGPRVIVALDYPEADEARSLVNRLPEDTWFKVGLELFTRSGPEFITWLTGEGRKVFLDLKLHDIPNTVAGAVRSACGLHVDLLTIHAAGGSAMMQAAAEAAAASAAAHRPRLLAITVLTSLDDRSLSEVTGSATRVADLAPRLADLARRAGLDGAVCSVGEAAALKDRCGGSFLVVTPGIRLPGDDVADQRRVFTPADARDAGADFIVVGRSITRSTDPASALATVRDGLVS